MEHMKYDEFNYVPKIKKYTKKWVACKNGKFSNDKSIIMTQYTIQC